MALSKRELVYRQIAHQETAPIPYTLGWEGDVGERLDAHYGSDSWRTRLDNAIRHVPTPNLVVDQTGGQDFVIDPYGTRWRLDRRPFHLDQPVLQTVDLSEYAFPDLDPFFTPEWRMAARQKIEADPAHFWVAGFGFGLYERTWAMRGFMEALVDAAGDPDYYDELVERIAEHQIAIIRRLVQLPLDGIMFSDDWGYQKGVLLGPDRWRRFIKPRLARMYQIVHEAGMVTLSHCCGSVADIMPDIIEIGLDVLESVQPEAAGMDPYALKRQYGEQITFWGGLGSQSTIPFGTPAEIRLEITKLCREMGRGGGYILTPSKGLQPETPTENAVAVVESFLEQEAAG
jgi:uroporphyrinogen decarboxylase